MVLLQLDRKLTLSTLVLFYLLSLFSRYVGHYLGIVKANRATEKKIIDIKCLAPFSVAMTYFDFGKIIPENKSKRKSS